MVSRASTTCFVISFLFCCFELFFSLFLKNVSKFRFRRIKRLITNERTESEQKTHVTALLAAELSSRPLVSIMAAKFVK